MTRENVKTQTISPSEAILLVIASFFLLLFGAAFVDWIGYGITMMLGELLLIVLPLGYMLLKTIDVKSYIGLQVNSRRILLGVIIGILLLFFEVIVNGVLVSAFGESEAVRQSNQIIAEMSRSAEGLIMVIATLVLAGICEEFTFRGFLQTAMNSKYPAWVALVTSSLVFGLFHFDPQAVYTLSAFSLGLVLGYVYHHWHSYTVSATAHVTLNLIVFALITLMPP
ncbi:MAG: type II CAAX endopeptidase family protein [Candidatus Bathyarchaeia archaeon]